MMGHGLETWTAGLKERLVMMMMTMTMMMYKTPSFVKFKAQEMMLVPLLDV